MFQPHTIKFSLTQDSTAAVATHIDLAMSRPTVAFGRFATSYHVRLALMFKFFPGVATTLHIGTTMSGW